MARMFIMWWWESFKNILLIDCVHANNSLTIYNLVEWLKRRVRDQQTLSVPNPLAPFCCVLGKDTLRHISLLDGPGKQIYITVISLLNYKRTAISWYLRKQVGVIAYPMY